MASPAEVVIGVDVGGTNTDAVILQTNCPVPRVLSSAKSVTTNDVTSGIKSAISLAIQRRNKDAVLKLQRINIGTTHFVNAVVQRKGLTKVAVIRLCGPASRKMPPFSDFPTDLALCINGGYYFADGGFQVDGRSILPVNEHEISKVAGNAISEGIKNFVVCGIFSPLRNDQEIFTKDYIQKKFPGASVTMSHEIGQVGLLERENASILNESLKPLCEKTISGFKDALLNLNLSCPLFLTQNDGTVVNEEYALNHPVCTFASGPTNSMRGAAFLSGAKDAIVIDIGGTTTDVGVLRKGFPREASTEVKIGGVRTNFRMPYVYSIGLGGGSYVKQTFLSGELDVAVGPRSAGYKLSSQALVYHKNNKPYNIEKLTATDLAVASGHCTIGDTSNVSILSDELVKKGIQRIKEMTEEAIDTVKLSADPLPVILVGGGSVLLEAQSRLKGTSNVIFPSHFDVANAVGAALSQMSGSVEYVVHLAEKISETDIEKLANEEALKSPNENIDKIRQKIRKIAMDEAIKEAKENGIKMASQMAEKGGVDIDSIVVLEKSDTPLSYIPGDANRINCKVVGDIKASNSEPVLIGTNFDCITLEESMEITQESEEIDTPLTISGKDEDVVKTKPYFNEKGEWILSLYDVECITVGTGIFGCGGGGSPHLGRVLAKQAIAEGKQIRVVNPRLFWENKAGNEGVVVQLGYMGAPYVIYEKLVSDEFISSLQCMEDLHIAGKYDDGELPVKDGVLIEQGEHVSFIRDYTGKASPAMKEQYNGSKAIIGIMSFEIGGLNAMLPLRMGADLGLPILDCDAMGRAYPELQMISHMIYGAKPYPATLVGERGRRAVIVKADSPKDLENHFRHEVVEMGCVGGLIMPPLTKHDVLNRTILFSVSRAWRLGDAVMTARKNKENPIDTILKHENGKKLISGKINDVRRETTGGFNRGFVDVVGLGSFAGESLNIEFQNENLIARRIDSDVVIACTPNLITMVDDDTGEPLTTEMVRYGLRVAVLVLPIADMMSTPTALKVVGPKAFGYTDVDYSPVGVYKDPEPVV